MLLRIQPTTPCQICFMSHTISMNGVTLPMLRLLSSKAQGCKDFWKSSKPCHVGTHWIVRAEYHQMSTHMPGFLSFFRFFASFLIGQISSSIRLSCKQPKSRMPVTFYCKCFWHMRSWKKCDLRWTFELTYACCLEVQMASYEYKYFAIMNILKV